MNTEVQHVNDDLVPFDLEWLLSQRGLDWRGIDDAGKEFSLGTCLEEPVSLEVYDSYIGDDGTGDYDSVFIELKFTTRGDARVFFRCLGFPLKDGGSD